MRRALTLIEMIFTILIIAVVFTVVPKIIFASNKAMALSMKEDALFHAYVLIGSISRLAWDENTLVAGKILRTTEHTCTDYRIGGFVGSRNCINTTLSASTLGSEGGDADDIDDYNGYLEPISVGTLNRYNLSATIAYGASKEIKRITATVAAHPDNNRLQNFQSHFFYDSANLGHVQIKKEQWQ
ncbi:MAG: hypothetical protein DSZ03_07675 [Sulfurimonas sp.]|nr:MAG: hypothetical protein DSZ03_07675 [Sulfurimonas sp.]